MMIYSVQPDGSNVKHIFLSPDTLTQHVRASQSNFHDAWMDMSTNSTIQSHLEMDWSDTLNELNGESQPSALSLLVPAPPTDHGLASRESETKASKLRKRQQWELDRSVAWTHWHMVVTPNAVDAYLKIEQQHYACNCQDRLPLAWHTLLEPHTWAQPLGWPLSHQCLG